MTDLEQAHAFLQTLGCQDAVCTFATGCSCAAEIADAIKAAERRGVERALRVLRERAEAYRRVHDYIAADLLETNANAIRDLLLLDQEVKR